MLAEEDISFIKRHLTEWLTEQVPGKLTKAYDIELHERMARMEEALKNQGKELKAQRELMQLFMQQVDKRFEQMQINIDKRFEQVDKRFEQMQINIDKRFEQVGKRFEQMQINIDKRFEQIDKRFEQVDKRFEQVDKRFEQVDKRFEQMHQDIMGIHQEIKLLMRWSFATSLTIGGLILAVLKIVS